MKSKTFAAIGLSPIVAIAKEVLLPPPSGATGDDVAIIWIHGAKCEPAAYTPLA